MTTVSRQQGPQLDVPRRTLRRLARIRRTVRRRLLAFGVFAVMAGGTAALLTVIALDWLLWLPAALRVLGALLFVGGFVSATHHWILRPIRATLSIDEIAGTLEGHFPHLRDRLSSAVNFIRRSDAGEGSELMTQVIARTDEVVDRVPLESALVVAPVARGGAAWGLSVLALVFIGWLAPNWLALGVERYAHPFRDARWPTRVEVQPLTGDLVAGMGESVIVRMKVVRGLEDGLRGVARLEGKDGSRMVLVMNRDIAGQYWTTVDSISQEFTYWFEAGDDTTRRHPGTIRVVHRPEVVQAVAQIAPPPYAPVQTADVADLTGGPVHVTEGCTITVRLRTNKPIPLNNKEHRPGLRFQDGTFVPLRVEGGELVGTFRAAGESLFRPELRDEYGFENRHSGDYAVFAAPDRIPVVTLLNPRGALDVTPVAMVRLSASAEDDYGVVAMRVASQPAPPQGRLSLPFSPIDERARARSIVVRTEFDWNLRGLALVPGDTVSYTVEAVDNRTLGEASNQVGSSSRMLLRVISATEMETQAREDMLGLEARLRGIALEQADVHDRTNSVQDRGNWAEALTQLEQETVAGLVGEQAAIQRKVARVASRMADIGDQLALNHVGDAKTRARVRDLARSLGETANRPLAAAIVALSAVRSETDATGQQKAVEGAAGSQAEALEALYGLLQELSQWGSFQGLVTRTRELVDRQTRLRNDTLRLGREMLGRSLDVLSDEQHRDLKRAMREQSQLEDDVDQHLANLEGIHDRLRTRDPASADAIDGALRVARAREIKRRLSSATEAVGKNRTAAATIEQRAVVEALRRMVSALREREARELAELRKRLESAEQRVGELLQEQKAIRTATHESALMEADHESLASLAMEQGVAAKNADLLGEELVEVDRAIPTARLVRHAAERMHQAERTLIDAATTDAVVRQDEAIALLEEALAGLERLAQEAAEQELRRSLFQIEEDLEAILVIQKEVNDGVGALVERVAQARRIRRAEARDASRLAREQSQARAMVEEMALDFEKVPVYRWAMERVGTWMDSAASALHGRRLDRELAATTGRTVRELEKLVAALVQTRQLPMSTEFVEAERLGGGGGRDSAETKPVPALSELIVLRAMQRDINDRTRVFREQYRADRATEVQLREMLMIAEDQAEVARLTRRVTEQVERQ